jgi:hypothetical protein
MRELPVLFTIVLTGVGLCLWACGWWTHRFWMVLAATLAAGITGLRIGPACGVQPIVAGLLAAVAAGCLALSLARAVVALVCGLACWYFFQLLLPQWTVPLICVLVGGMLGVVLHDFWVVVLTSFAGMVFLAYGGLVLTEKMTRFDAVRWVSQNPNLVHCGYVAAALFGIVVQYWVEQVKKRYQGWIKMWKEVLSKAKKPPGGEPKPDARGWLPRFLRKAG